MNAVLRRNVRHISLILVTGLAGLTYGIFSVHLPAPDEVTVFWVGNLASPWLVLAFLAGWSQRSPIWAAAAGVLADVAAAVGFYGSFLFLDPNPLPPQLHQSTPFLARAASNMVHWLGFVSPWLAIATLAGFNFGLIGYWWGRSRSMIAGVLVGLPFVLEPLGWTLVEGYLPHPYSVWIIEVVLGMGVLVWIIVARNGYRAFHTR